ncbi:MAG: hypothetical protein K0R92_3491 [Lachnospiraceae bacterium]|jgi:uncharacterized membrane protein|nr:hypothetical protein [Lachnospiraceae bacterium]
MNVNEMNKNQVKQQKAYRRWKKWMQWGEKTGCHQMPERSFFINGYQMPLCSRCFGVIIGYILAIPIFLVMGFIKSLSFAGCLIMFVDWFIQFVGIRKSTNTRRLITGIPGGFGIMSIQLNFIKKLIQRLH